MHTNDVPRLQRTVLRPEGRAVLVPVGAFDDGARRAAAYGNLLAARSRRALHVIQDESRANRLAHEWMNADLGLPLDMVNCQTSVADGVVASVGALLDGGADHVLVVVCRRLGRNRRSVWSHRNEGVIEALERMDRVVPAIVTMER